MTTYVEGLLARARTEMPDCDDDLLRFYVLLVLVRGRETTLVDVHDAWSLWRMITVPNHPAIIPFEELSLSTQELDRSYRDAIRRIAS